ncbi:hypothetical protein G4B88_013262, partial [Cannabis sativa]
MAMVQGIVRKLQTKEGEEDRAHQRQDILRNRFISMGRPRATNRTPTIKVTTPIRKPQFFRLLSGSTPVATWKPKRMMQKSRKTERRDTAILIGVVKLNHTGSTRIPSMNMSEHDCLFYHLTYSYHDLNLSFSQELDQCETYYLITCYTIHSMPSYNRPL